MWWLFRLIHSYRHSSPVVAWPVSADQRPGGAPPPAPVVAPRAGSTAGRPVSGIYQDVADDRGSLRRPGQNNGSRRREQRREDGRPSGPGLGLRADRGDDDDFRLSAAVDRIPEFVVDVRIGPSNGDMFTDQDLGRLGDTVQLTTPQFVTLRTRGAASADGSGPLLDRHWLAGWSCDHAEALASLSLSVLGRTSSTSSRFSSSMLDVTSSRRSVSDEATGDDFCPMSASPS